MKKFACIIKHTNIFLNLYSEGVSSWTFTLKERLPALRGFSVRVESQGLESGTELVREDCFNTNLFTCLLNGWDILQWFIWENGFPCFPLQMYALMFCQVFLFILSIQILHWLLHVWCGSLIVLLTWLMSS